MLGSRRAVTLALGCALAAFAVAAHWAATAPEAPQALGIHIQRPLGGQTAERVVTVQGTVTGYRGDRITLVANGIPMTVPLQNGGFTLPQVLSPGANAFRAVVEQDGASAEDSVALHASVPSKDLRVTLTWDTPGTDVDLWVTGPDGEKVMYNNRQGKAGGILDTDVTSGFGPETYTQARLQKGTYRVQAHYYGGQQPSRVEVTSIRFEGTPEEERRVFHAILWKTGDVAEVGEFTAK